MQRGIFRPNKSTIQKKRSFFKFFWEALTTNAPKSQTAAGIGQIFRQALVLTKAKYDFRNLFYLVKAMDSWNVVQLAYFSYARPPKLSSSPALTVQDPC